MTPDKLVSVCVDDGIAYICVDIQGESVNTLSPAMSDRMREILAGLRHEKNLQGAVVYSGKKDFIVGFDIKELKRFASDPSGLKDLVKQGHDLMAEFDALGIPFVAAIQGNCLGGGLEVALACHGRVASESPKTRLGLPEVMLGVIPGAGGTQRLPRLVDLQVALDMVLSGKQLNAKKALKAGLVDDVVHPAILLQSAAELARKLNRERNQKDAALDLKEVLADPAAGAMKLVAATPARALIFNKAREAVMKQTKGHYPAPLKALEVIEKGLSKGFQAGLEAEAAAFVELVQTDVARNLINLFFMKTEIDKDPVVGTEVQPTEVRRLGVLGAGLMGAGIVQVAASKGYNVRLKDRDRAGLGWGLNYCNELFQKQVSRRSISAAEADIQLGRISGTTTYEGFERCEIVVEAVFEDVALKQQILADVEALGNPDLIFASNTSTIPIATIAEHAKYPENVIGMHFFSPVHKMPLLEIIRTDKTSDRAIATTLKVGRDMGKTCIVVSDGPGFFTSRVVGSYLNEAGWILQEGSSVEAIDQTMEAFGFPVGPMKLTDEVGIDVSIKAAKVLGEAFKDRLDQPTALLVIADEGRKGRKNGKGLYVYGGETRGVDVTVYDKLPGGRVRRDLDRDVIRDRIWLAMLNECAYCLQEGIAASPRDIDIGVIFGLGFPPFRGGICRYADTVGLAKVVGTLDRLSDKYGKRLAPAQILVDMAKKNEKFYKG